MSWFKGFINQEVARRAWEDAEAGLLGTRIRLPKEAYEEPGKYPTSSFFKSPVKGWEIWRNGNRYSVALHGEKIVRRPMFFGTAGQIPDGNMEKMFHNPENYKIIPFDNTWKDDKFIPSNDKPNFDDYGKPI